MKKFCVAVSNKKLLRHMWTEDLAKMYYIKKRPTPKLPKFSEDDSDFSQPGSPKVLVEAQME